MPPLEKLPGAAKARRVPMLLAAILGFAAAAVVGVAVAKTFTLHVATHARVTNQMGVTKSEGIVVNSRALAVYDLTGDSKKHPECTKANGCFSLWPPVKVSSPKDMSKGPGVRGKLGTWHRDGFFQVTLNGQPLYRYALDPHPKHGTHATGEGIVSFGGTWHVNTTKGSSGGTTTTMPMPCLYPPC